MPNAYAHAQSTENKYLFQVPPVPWSFTRSHHDVVERPVGTAVQRKADSNRHTCLSLCQPPPPLQLRVVGTKFTVSRARAYFCMLLLHDFAISSRRGSGSLTMGGKAELQQLRSILSLSYGPLGAYVDPTATIDGCISHICCVLLQPP